jgi:hypothetical protein
LGWPKSFACHNQKGDPSLRPYGALVGDTLYCITCHLMTSTRKWNKCMSISPTKDFGPILQASFDPSTKKKMVFCNWPWNSIFEL